MKRTLVYDPENPRRQQVLDYFCAFVRDAGARLTMTVAEPTRNLESNAAMWAMLADVSRQVQWPVNGKMQLLASEDWKEIISAGLKQENRIAQGLAGGFVMLGSRTSKMTQRQMGELLDLIGAFGSEQGVLWTDPPAKDPP